MNWYKIFYWVSVADSVKAFFTAFCIIFSILSCISVIGFFISTYYVGDSLIYSSGEPSKDSNAWAIWAKGWKRILTISCIIGLISWFGFIFVPNKRDFVTIIAGGAVGNFITKDSSAKQIPSEVMTLLRDKIREEIRNTHVDDIKDTLESKSKEELIKMVKDKSTDKSH